MKRILMHIFVIAVVTTSFTVSALGQEVEPLEAQDYVDIRNLIDTYPHLLDYCINNGNDYADLFTDDATFGVSSQWDTFTNNSEKTWFRGREQIRRAGGGGDNNCVTRPSAGYHLNINPAIVATAEGAKSTSTLLTIMSDTSGGGDRVHWEGGYEDTYQKTAAGWRFKSRVHVWPEIDWTDDPADMPPRDLEDE